MHTRRDFLKRATLLSSAAAFSGAFPESIQRAFAIDPALGSSYLDAEHVVILMQENRSFDHALGTLRGVRGFNDPRALRLANNAPVWLQTNAKGETYAPFRFDIKDTRATWMSYLPHNRHSQVDAWNSGLYDQWLEAKRSHKLEYADMPLTMGHYTREDIPFYYALADAFTVCDQNFSGAMTETTPNRSIFWTGTVRKDAASPAHLYNDDYFDNPMDWPTFPEQLRKNGISWKFYQNELWREYGLTQDAIAWLSNYGCNILELFAQYNVNKQERYQQNLPQAILLLEEEVAELEKKAAEPNAPAQTLTDLRERKNDLAQCKKDVLIGSGAFARLTPAEQELHLRAFTTNVGDPDFHSLEELSYQDGATQRNMTVPKGDVLHQFREDVEKGQLPTVSWLAAPERFSDHPTAPWYGAWYLSEVMDILTKDPEVWKKTIFILTYDENDGYFDHIPPYVAPDPRDKTTGSVSPGLVSETEYVYRQDEVQQGIPEKNARTGPVGMGFRVPMIVASPWSRGGWVNSQLFEHTSVNQFLEHFLNSKYGSKVREENISPWRRAVSGDLTSIFRRFDGEKPTPLPFLERDPFVEGIHKAQFQPVPSDYRKLSDEEIASVAQNTHGSGLLPHQEKGVRPSCALPYELYVEAGLSGGGSMVEMRFRAEDKVFGKQAMGAPFNVYARSAGHLRGTSHTVAAGDSLQESWPLDSFSGGTYRFEVYGPNGFFREFAGSRSDPALAIACEYEVEAPDPKRLTGHIVLQLANTGSKPYAIEIVDHAYGAAPVRKRISGKEVVVLNLEQSFGWYDFSVKVDGFADFEKRYAGHVETGRHSASDPFMGGTMGGMLRV
ncbi:MAG TPA: phospholipase C, phosphocholine-specific [Acidobacteriaceae bacterium]|jgi:phospholipase C|nr:phospholipase C, phosphocholine-specific [Acidobacteriaceae bacterium]